MLSRQILRAASQRTPLQTLRSTAQRRFASTGPKLEGAADNEFNRERAAVKAHAAATSDLWRKLSIYMVVPALVLASLNAYNLWNEHWEHWEHMPPLEERPQYEYLNIRNKNYPFGDGSKTLFWNEKVNYINKNDE